VRGGQPADAAAEDHDLRHALTLYGRHVRVRRDQLVLGAVAAALLLGIVAFAATSTIPSHSEQPTPTATPASERDLFGGSLEPRVRYRTRSFAPTLSFVAGDTEWLVQEATERSHLVVERRIRGNRPGSELPSESAVIFSRIFELIDPATGTPLPRDENLYAWFSHHPDLRVGRAEPVTIAGIDGLQFDEAVRFDRPARSAAACRAQLTVCTLIAPERYFPDGVRMHTIVLPLGQQAPLVIDIVGRTQRDLDAVEAPAEQLLRTLTVTEP
jgi:hypothetical protein